MSFLSEFQKRYNSEIQLSPFQAQAIGAAIKSRSPGCNLLVFGLGNDTGLWLELNQSGRTVFLETSETWTKMVKERYANIEVYKMPTFGLTVEESMKLQISDIQEYAVIQEVADQRWDVILVDAPPGYASKDPGRAVAIFWAHKLSTEGTHIFVDDYERDLESKFADLILRDKRGTCTIVVPNSDREKGRKLLWSMGNPQPA